MVHQNKLINCYVESIFKYILCYGSSNRGISRTCHVRRFKYILCYGSSFDVDQLLVAPSYLNTSYVMVHLIIIGLSIVSAYNLNTSYVMVHHGRHHRF